MAQPAQRSGFIHGGYPVTSFGGQVQTVIIAVFEITWLSVWQNEAACRRAAYT